MKISKALQKALFIIQNSTKVKIFLQPLTETEGGSCLDTLFWLAFAPAAATGGRHLAHLENSSLE